MNTDTKNALMSRGVWGGIMSAVAFVAILFGVNIGDPQAWANDITTLVTVVFGAIGPAMAVWGRVKATKRIG